MTEKIDTLLFLLMFKGNLYRVTKYELQVRAKRLKSKWKSVNGTVRTVRNIV